MSYILEALRKVERQRRVRAIPDLATVHGPSPARRFWRPVVLGVLLVHAGFLALLLWYRPWAPSVPPPPPLARAPAADVAGPPPAASEASAPATAPPDVGPPTSSPTVAPAPPVVAPAPPPAVVPAPSLGAASSGPGPTAGVVTSDVPAPSAPRVRVTPPASPGDATAARDTATPEPTSTPERPGAAAPSSPAPPAPRAAARAALPSDLPAPFRDAVSQLRLEALVYADSPKDRKVFINSRRYVEGDKLDNGIVVERIVEEGVVLSYAGHRFVLRHFR